MKCVYLLESLTHLGKRYVGTIADLKRRLDKHNEGKSPYTRAFRPGRR